LAFQPFDFERIWWLMKVIPEKRRAHYIWYLRFYVCHVADIYTTNNTSGTLEFTTSFYRGLCFSIFRFLCNIMWIIDDLFVIWTSDYPLWKLQLFLAIRTYDITDSLRHILDMIIITVINKISNRKHTIRSVMQLWHDNWALNI
jgi:hypothetical protein